MSFPETPPEDVDLDDSILTEEELGDLEEAEPEPTLIAYSGQDFDVDGLVRRMRDEDIKIPRFGHSDTEIASAGFQRSFVWSRPQMDRFIESLLLGYPVPGIFLVRQTNGLYLVLDGQQRLRTMRFFYDGIVDKKEFALRNVSLEFRDLTYATLPRELKRKIDNAFIPAIIVNTDGTADSLDAVYQIFERLNSGGTQLTPHEIRVALYAGPFIDRLELLNKDLNWRALYGAKSPRVRDQELLLRILALYLDHGSYARPLKGFLNDFTAAHRSGTDSQLQAAEELLKRAAEVLAVGPGPAALRKASRQVNTAQTEAIFVGLMRALAAGSSPTSKDVADALETAKKDPRFEAATGRATADEEQVSTRLQVATQAFSSI